MDRGGAGRRRRAAAAAHRAARRRPARPEPVRGRDPREGRRRARPARPRPAAPRRRPRRRVGAHLEVDPHDRRAAHGPVGGRRRRQRLPLRGALPAPPVPGHPGPQPQARLVAADLGRPRAPDAARRRHRAHRHRRGPGARRRGRARPRRGAAAHRALVLRLQARPGCRASSAGPRSAPAWSPAATCSGAAAASAAADRRATPSPAAGVPRRAGARWRVLTWAPRRSSSSSCWCSRSRPPRGRCCGSTSRPRWRSSPPAPCSRSRLPALDEVAKEGLTLLTELTLALILFHDAAQVRPRRIAVDRGPMARLLLVGLPLTMAAGWLLGLGRLPGRAADDAAAPRRRRRPHGCRPRRRHRAQPGGPGAGAADAQRRERAQRRARARRSCCSPSRPWPARRASRPSRASWAALGRPGRGHRRRRRRRRRGRAAARAGRATHGSARGTPGLLAALVLPLIAYFGAELAGGNAFVAAFVAGTAFAGPGALARGGGVLARASPRPWPTRSGSRCGSPSASSPCPLLVENVGWPEIVFAVLALTLLRMVPVALALLGTGSAGRRPWPSSAGSGPAGWPRWSSPCSRLEGLELDAALTQVVATICLTVLLSVLAHGLSAEPLARRYGAWVERTRPTQELARVDRAAQPPLAAPPRRPPSRPDRRPDGIRPTLDTAPAGAMPRANAEHAGPTTALNPS